MSIVGSWPCNVRSENSTLKPNFSTTKKSTTHGAHESYQAFTICQHHRVVPPTRVSTNGSTDATSYAMHVDQPRMIACAGDGTSTVLTPATAHRRRPRPPRQRRR